MFYCCIDINIIPYYYSILLIYFNYQGCLLVVVVVF